MERRKERPRSGGFGRATRATRAKSMFTGGFAFSRSCRSRAARVARSVECESSGGQGLTRPSALGSAPVQEGESPSLAELNASNRK